MAKRMTSNWSVTAKAENPERFGRQAALPRLTEDEWAEMMGAPRTPPPPPAANPGALKAKLVKAAKAARKAGCFNGIRIGAVR